MRCRQTRRCSGRAAAAATAVSWAVRNQLESLIQRAKAEHDCGPGATAGEIADAEDRVAYSFTDELRALLQGCNGIDFWKAGDYPCRLLSTTEIKPARVLLETDEGPPALVAILEADGNFVGLDLDRQSKSYSRLIDCFHETFPYELFGICDSMQEMLTLILDSKGQDWIWQAARAYDVHFAD